MSDVRDLMSDMPFGLSAALPYLAVWNCSLFLNRRSDFRCLMFDVGFLEEGL